MHVIEAFNVRDALPKAIIYLLNCGTKEHTRCGEAYVAPVPVTIHYQNPKQHVLLNKIRDANPFFHLMEAMWMLAGRDDTAFLDYYIKDFGKKFGKDGVMMDAYGQRWRHGLRMDQLDQIAAQLYKDPGTRQCVLQMWGAGRNDLMAYSMKPCNLVATFRIRDIGTPVGELPVLDMTVFNRSNDLIWGSCGANAVHFPIMQEYLAARIGVEIGEYWQISTNLHFYTAHYEMLLKRIPDKDATLDWQIADVSGPYGPTVPLIDRPDSFDEDLMETMDFIDEIQRGIEININDMANRFLVDTVLPMALAHREYKNKNIDSAIEMMKYVQAEDWRTAGTEWLERRKWKSTTQSD